VGKIPVPDNFFKLDCNFLSSVVAVRWTTFFFLRAVPFPPILTCNHISTLKGLSHAIWIQETLKILRAVPFPPILTCKHFSYFKGTVSCFSEIFKALSQAIRIQRN
jgi:hypothetical protein